MTARRVWTRSMGTPPGAGKREKKSNPGTEFEDAVRRSVPASCYVRRLRTPTGMGFAVPRLVDLVRELSRALGDRVPDWVGPTARFSYTPKAGFDLLITAPARVDSFTLPVPAHGLTPPVRVQPCILLACELKSIDGASLPFSNVDPDQEKALKEAADAGHLAFLVIEFRRAGEVWAVPIQAWAEARSFATRASLPVEDARRIGMAILPDPGRGESKPYWKVGAWIEACGAVLPGRAAKKRATATKQPEAPAARGLFD